MKIQTIRERLLASTMIAGAAMVAMAATPAMAQQEDEVESIVITGSRIPQPNLVTTSPVTQVTGEDVDVAGVTRVEDLVNQLPQAFAAAPCQHGFQPSLSLRWNDGVRIAGRRPKAGRERSRCSCT